MEFIVLFLSTILQRRILIALEDALFVHIRPIRCLTASIVAGLRIALAHANQHSTFHVVSSQTW